MSLVPSQLGTCPSQSQSSRHIICTFEKILPPSPPTLNSRRGHGMFGYLIDMDGVIYRGNHLIPGADFFIRGLRDSTIPFLFLTNNSQRTRRDVVTKLQRLGIEVEEEHVFTCAMA